MAYSTGSATGPQDLLDKLRTFLIAQSWTVNLWTTVGSGYRLHVQKTTSSSGVDMYFNFRSYENETMDTEEEFSESASGIAINGSTGYNVANDWDKQPVYSVNGSGDSCCMLMHGMSLTAIPNYWFFEVGDSVHVIVETTAGYFQGMSFGTLLKQGVYTGGMYFTASLYGDLLASQMNGGHWYGPHFWTQAISGVSGYVYVDVDGTADWRQAEGSVDEILMPCVAGQTANSNYTQMQLASFFWGSSPDSYNSQAPGCPLYVLVKRSDTNYSLLGWPEGIRFLNCLYYSAGEEVTYGGDTWKIFNLDKLSGWNPAEGPDNPYTGFALLKEV